jgi:type I restriction enzyme M protein
LIPTQVISRTYFKKEIIAIDELEHELDELIHELDEIVNEFTGEDDPFEEARSDAGNITKSALRRRIREIENDSEYKEDLTTLQTYQEKDSKVSEIKKILQTKQDDLISLVDKKRSFLSYAEIKSVVVTQKWFSRINEMVYRVINQKIDSYTFDINQLCERYNNPIFQLNKKVKDLYEKVFLDLIKLGYEK